jgi:hypothetical protein
LEKPPPTQGVVVAVCGLPELMGGNGFPMVVSKITVVVIDAPPNRELFGRKLPSRFQ